MFEFLSNLDLVLLYYLIIFIETNFLRMNFSKKMKALFVFDTQTITKK